MKTLKLLSLSWYFNIFFYNSSEKVKINSMNPKKKKLLVVFKLIKLTR